MAEVNGKSIGVLRFDARGDGGWDVSINLAPEARGQRMSVPVLTEGARWLQGRTTSTRIHAFVKVENPASLKAFSAAGYDEVARNVDHVELALDLASSTEPPQSEKHRAHRQAGEPPN